MQTRPLIIIMAGGRGERLWPLVRADRPKVCVAPDGTHTLLEATLRRLGPLARPSDVWIITTAGQERPIRRVLPAAWRTRVLVEPQPRNTAACIALGTAIAAASDPSRVVIALPADHWIEPASAFQRALRTAVAATRRDATRLAVIGLAPQRAHAGLGYLVGRQGRLRRFVEKPSPAAVKRLIHAGARWNAGMFIGQADAFLKLIARYLPQHAARLVPLGRLAGTPRFAAAARAAYRGLENISFDHGVMAHVTDGDLVEGRFAWEDLGSWDSWARVNAAMRPPIMIGGRNVRTVSANGHVIAAVGLDDVIVVHTEDATLVCRSTSAQTVRDVARRVSNDPRLAHVS